MPPLTMDFQHRVPLSDETFPGLYRSADLASRNAQGAYLRLQRAYLGSLVAASVVSAFVTFASASFGTEIFTILALILAIGLIILWIGRTRQDDKAWFDGRAVAESVKTATWRFMMRAPPFDKDAKPEEQFVAELAEIREARPRLAERLAAVMTDDQVAITEMMRDIRSADVDTRRYIFIQNRLKDQKKWYSGKARWNARRGGRWFWIIVSLQIAGVSLAIVQASVGGFRLSAVSVLTTCSAACAAWSQVKRHEDLAQAYALAAQELEALDSLADRQDEATNFLQLVEQTEESISREHTMWCARRDVRLPSGSRRQS